MRGVCHFLRAGQVRREMWFANFRFADDAPDFGEWIAATELGRIGTQDNDVGLEVENCLHSPQEVGRDLVSRISQDRGNVFSEGFVGLDN